MWCPSADDVILMHRKLITRSGGADGIRSFPLIESAVQRFHASYAGEDAHPTIEEKAAAVACGLIQNHGFVDGNKRVGAAVMLLILSQNGLHLRYDQHELVSITLAVASGTADVAAVAAWIISHKG